jgi:hypothetical protein
MLSPGQRRPAPLADQAEEVLRHRRDRPPGTPLPRGVRRGVDDDLADDAPAGVMGLAAGEQKAGECLGQDDCIRLRPVNVEVAQPLGHPATAPHGAGELLSRPPGSWLSESDRRRVAAAPPPPDGSARVEIPTASVAAATWVQATSPSPSAVNAASGSAPAGAPGSLVAAAGAREPTGVRLTRTGPVSSPIAAVWTQVISVSPYW